MTDGQDKKTRGLSRRDFLRVAAAGSLGSLAVASGLGAREARAATKTAAKMTGAATLPVRPFGKTGLEVPALGLGASIDFTQNQLLLKQALKQGINYWDTSSVYSNGKSEEGIGIFFGKHPEERRNVILVTKSWRVATIKGLDQDLNTSLEKLKTDYVDLFFFHGIDSLDAVDTAEMRAWVEAQKKAGKFRHVGFSTHKNMAPLMERAPKLGWLDGFMTSINYRLMDEEDMKRGLDVCVQAGLGIAAMKTQGGGPIADTKEDRKLAGHFVEKGWTPQQAKVKAMLADARIACVVSHMDTIEVMESNITAVQDKTGLETSDVEALRRHARATCATYCSGCGRCERAIGGEVPVSRIMRYLMYSRDYGQVVHAHERFAHLPARLRAGIASADFARAERVCPQGLAITKLLREAAVELG